MKFLERIQASLAPQNYQIEHFCGGEAAAVTSVKATETVCRIYTQKQSDLELRGPEQRLARMLIKNGEMAFPIFNTLDVCRSCARGPLVRPSGRLVKIK